MENLTRNQLQTKAMICIYQYLFYLRAGIKPEIKDIIEGAFDGEKVKIDPFIKEVVVLSIKKMPEIVENISPLLNKWTFDRLGLIEQAILSLGYLEIKYLNIPKEVAIDIAVKLAVKYADDKSYKFINAVLEKI
ncbi:MAG: transcription antitermination factor NusB [Bacilli bacterium]|nr:transcription antitermination factor NusB [Bacilli bacterium]